MGNSSTIWTASKQAARLFSVVLLAAGLSACGGDNGSNNGGEFGPDAGGDTSVDADAQADADVRDQDTGDAGADTDAQPDTGPPDDDTDGVVNAEDNCPEAANADQIDFDRDDVGDACDHYAFIHDPSNPETFSVTAEDEANISNDGAREGEAYKLTTPFVVEGAIGDIEDGQSDWDYYSFSISEPTLVLVRLEASGNAYWPGGAMIGYESRNGNVQRFVIGEETGGSHYREMFLPVPGRYSFAVTDSRNMMQSPDVGGEDFTYTVSVSAIPMPTPEQIRLPAAPVEKDVDRRVHVYEVDLDSEDALTVASTGVPLGDNSLDFPLLALYDPDENRTLSFTSPYQTNRNTAKVEYTTILGDRDRVWIVEDFWQRFGLNKTLLEVNEAQVDSEFETFSKAQDSRSSELVWLQPGLSIDATIGPPRTVTSTSLAADVDYFLASIMPGSMVTFTITPTEGSAMQPDVDLGYLYEQQTSSDFYWMQSGPSADDPGEAVKVTAFYDGTQAGEAAVRIRHAPNMNAESPVGGPGYGYQVSMQVSAPAAEDLGQLPAVVNGAFDTPGKTDFYAFSASAGDRLNFRIEENNYFGEITVYDAQTYQRLLQSYSNREVLALEQDRDLIVHVTPYNDERDPAHTYELGVETIEATEVGQPPVQEDGVVDTRPFPAWFKMPVAAGKAYQASINTQSSDFEGRIRVYDGATMDEIRGGSGTVSWMAPDDGEVYIEVADAQNRGDADYQFTLDIAALNSSSLALDTPTSGQLADGAKRHVYSFSAPAGGIDANVTTDGSWQPHVVLAEGDTLREYGDALPFGGSVHYAESKGRDYALIVSATDETLAGPLDYEVEVNVHEPSSATAENEPNDTLAQAEPLAQTPAVISGSFEDGTGDTTDVFTLDLVDGQRVWAMSINRNNSSLYTIDPEIEIYDPSGARVARDRDNGEGYFPSLYAFEATTDGTFEIRHQLEFGGDTGDYTLYVFTSTP